MLSESKPLLVNIDELGETGSAIDRKPRQIDAPWNARYFDFTAEKKIDRVYFVGVFLAFWLVFSMWCLWDAFVEFVTKDQGAYPNVLSVKINLVTISGCLFVLVLLRFGVGPVLGPVARSVFSLVLVFFAICFWETLEGAIGVLVKDDLKTEATVYAVMLVGGLVATAVYEWTTSYDVIGNHLLL